MTHTNRRIHSHIAGSSEDPFRSSGRSATTSGGQFRVALVALCLLLVAPAAWAQKGGAVKVSRDQSKAEAMTVQRSAAAPPPPPPSAIVPPEIAAGCPVPTLAQCLAEGYLAPSPGTSATGRSLDGSSQRLSCGQLQAANHWTCSKLMQDQFDAYHAGAGLTSINIEESGIVESSHKVDQDRADSLMTESSPEASVPANLYYQSTIVGDPASVFPGSGDFAARDPRETYLADGDGFDSCQEYAYEQYYEVTNFWWEIGRTRHDYLQTFEAAFGPASVHTSIGTRNPNADDYFTNVRYEEMQDMPTSRTGYRNRFLDLPEAYNFGDTLVIEQGGGRSPVRVTGADLRTSLRHYNSTGEEIIEMVENFDYPTITKDMDFYETYFDNLTVEGTPELGLTFDDGTREPGSDPISTIGTRGNTDPQIDPIWAAPGDGVNPMEITGQVPLPFARNKMMRRMFSAELDELYNLQVEKDRLVAEWLDLDRQFAGSGWKIGDLLEALEIDDYVAPSGGDSGGIGDLQIGGGGGGGVCCGPVDTGGSFGTVERPSYGTASRIEGENAARKIVLDGLLSVYSKAESAGCLESAPTYCDFSVKEFALEAVTHAVEEQQAAYEECVDFLPSPFTANLGETRTFIDPETDTEGVLAEYKGNESYPRDSEYSGLEGGAEEWAELTEMARSITVPSKMYIEDLDALIEFTLEANSLLALYQARLENFLAGAVAFQAELEERRQIAAAKMRIASNPELIDPDTGEVKMPGRSASWDESKGSKYFGIDMQYNYAFETDLGEGVCDFGLTAGGDFSSEAKILTRKASLVDVALWLRTDAAGEEEMVDIHAEVMGVALFSEMKVENVASRASGVDLTFIDQDHSFDSDFASLSQTFMLGPVPLSLSVGAGGRLGYRFNSTGDFMIHSQTDSIGQVSIAGCPELIVDATLEPFVGIYGFVEVAIDVVILAAGVRGEITILDLSLPVGLDFQLAPVEIDRAPYIDLELAVGMDASAEFETLAGKISAFAKIGICPFFCKRVEKTVVSWDGFSWDKELYRQTYGVSVGDLILATGSDS